MKRRHIILLHLFILLNINVAFAQWKWEKIGETLQRYGAPITFMHDSIRPCFLAHMKDVGYMQCYNDYYDVLCQASEQTRQHKDSMMYDLGMSRLFMSWQNDKTSANDVLTGMQQLMNECENRYGITSCCYSTLVVIMAEFYNSIGNYVAADSCCNRIIDYKSYKQNVRSWQYCMALHAKMVAEIGSGKFSDVSNTVDKIWRKAETPNYFSENDKLSNQYFSETAKKTAATLARQMTLDFLPPSPKAITNNIVEPWPLDLSFKMLYYEEWNVLAVFQLYELLFKMHLSQNYDRFIVNNIGLIGKSEYNSYGDCSDFLSQQIQAEMNRREAMITQEWEEKLGTLDHPHNNEDNIIIRRWSYCIGSEQLNGGERSALSLLSFSIEWIKKGYPINVLPLVEEAADVMRRNLNNQRPTLNQLLDQRHNREWLAKELPKLIPLVNNIPEYAPSLEIFKSLAASNL